jgi:hypothetical protein
MKLGKGGRPTPADKLLILQRRKRVAAAYLDGRPQWEIAEREGIAQQTVSDDLKAIRKEWRASALMDFDARQAQELAKIDNLETMAREAWERSCKDAETFRVKTETEGKDEQGRPIQGKTISEKTSRGQAGDPRFLERIGWCIDQRCKILGLVVNKVAPVTPDGMKPYEPISDEQTRLLVGGLFARLGLGLSPEMGAGPSDRNGHAVGPTGPIDGGSRFSP